MIPRSTAIILTFSLAVAVLAVPPAFSDGAVAGQAISRADPEQMLQQATTELLEISKAARSYIDVDRERYYNEVAAVLDQVMDIQYFARGVMATYASARLYKSLQTDAERAAFRERVERFEVALKRVWMVKYADALLRSDGETIELARIHTGADSDDRASLEQTITDREGQTYLVQYSLHRVKDGDWLIANVIVEGVNLGQIYRSQFAEAVENNRGDVDYVVDHWVELMIHEQSPANTAVTGGG